MYYFPQKHFVLPPVRLRNSKTSFSVFWSLASRSVIFSAMFLTFSSTVPRFWVMEVREQMLHPLVDPELWRSVWSFSRISGSQRQQLNARMRTAIFFIFQLLKALLLCTKVLPFILLALCKTRNSSLRKQPTTSSKTKEQEKNTCPLCWGLLKTH